MSEHEACGYMVYGYDVKVINLIDMEKSHHYNPFHYIRKEQDVVN